MVETQGSAFSHSKDFLKTIDVDGKSSHSEKVGQAKENAGPQGCQVEFLMKEYEALWDYYKRTLEEREVVLNYFFRTVTIPSAGLATLLFVKIRSEAGNSLVLTEITPEIVSAGLAVIFVVGLSCLMKYHLEAENSRHYLQALNRIRDFFRDHYADINSYLIVDQILPKRCSLLLQIKFYGSSIIALINSAVAVSAVALMKLIDPSRIAIVFIAILSAQLLVAQFAARKRSENNQL